MTLTEILPAVRQLAASEKLRLIRILAEELDSIDDSYPLEANRVYYVGTPYNTFGAGKLLMDAMMVADHTSE